MYYFLLVFSFKKQQNIERYWKKMKKNTGKVREYCQSGKVGTMKKDDKIGIEPVSKSDVFLCDEMTGLLINLPAVSSNSNSSEKLKL